jgi:hypothetical protein
MMTANGVTITPQELKAVLEVAKEYRVTVLKMGDLVIQMEPSPLPFEAEPDTAVINGGWKRSPNLNED